MLARCRAAWLVSTLVLTTPSLVAGQSATTGEIRGIVRDESSAVLAGAMVTATRLDTGAARSVTADDQGHYLLLALTPGTYRVEARFPGFRQQADDIVLTIGLSVDVDFTLRVAGIADSVAVIARPPLVDLRRTVLSEVVTQREIESLPVNGRDFISFALNTPGVASDRTSQQGASATSRLTFAGQRARSNNITVDGLDNNDATTGGIRATFSQEAVREFQVLTNSFSAEFGKASGGVVNIVTRDGTNDAAGSVFAFFRDDALNAREHFERFTPAGERIDRPKAPYRHVQAGAIAGGPIRRDRTFYFLSAERLAADASNFVTVDDHQPVSVGGRSVGTAADILRAAGFAVETGHVPYRVESTQFLGKVNHRLRADHDLNMRISAATDLNEAIEPWGGLVARSRGAALDSTDVTVASAYTAVFAPKLLNDLRMQIAWRDQLVRSLDPACGGSCDASDQGGPTVEVSGVASVGRQRFTPQARDNVRFQLVDTFGYYRAAHHVKSGIDYSFIDTRAASLPLQFGGRFVFSPLPAIPGVLPAPVSAVQALALGLPAAYVQGYGNPNVEFRYHDVSLFAQDDWRVRSNLTLQLGVRWQRQYWPGFQYEARGTEPFTLHADNNNVAPRLAVAWQPWSPRTSLHAAYGTFYDNHLTSIVTVPAILDGSSAGVRTSVLRFPRSLAAWSAPNRRLSENAVGTFPSLVYLPDPALETPYAHHASAGVNHELSGAHVLSINYVHVRGHNQVGTLDYNPLVPALGADRRPEDDVVNGVAVPGTSASVLQFTTFGETWYRGLTLSLARRWSDRFGYLVSYTFSRAEDNSTDFQSAFIPENTGRGRDHANPRGLPVGFDPASEKGLSVQDQRHRLTLTGMTALPGAAVVSTIVTLGTGRPFTALAGTDLNGDGNGGAFPPDRARRVPSDPSTSLPRNSETMPAFATVDMRLSRRFRLRDVTLEAMVDVFNLFNRTNFTEVNNIFGIGTFPSSPSSTYGQFEKAAAPRQLQLAASLRF